jgi:asparagine synthase (glutamine-hydrolysing)
MCGIAGIIGRVAEPNRAALRRMSAAMAHRGPDAEGTWESRPDERGWGALLAHRRLSILDLSPAGAQPMVDPRTGHVVVFNGEIYNYVALRDRLTDGTDRLASSGDTAVLLRALALHGAEATGWLRGMFAFALWAPRARSLLLARDPLGIKPLYLARNPDPDGEWALAFASEVRALLASGLLARPRLDPRAAASVAWNGFIVGPSTVVEGIEAVWPGQQRLYDARGAEQRSDFFWAMPSPAAGEQPPADDEAVSEALEACVELHLASDVPLGVFLSGGVDSSAVANLAQRTAGGAVRTFTLAFEEEEFDEAPFARQIARAIGTEHQEVVLTEARFVEQLEGALDSLDQPTFDGLNSYYMSRAVREAGFKVALVGTGGDELFGGYTSFRDLPVLHRWARRTGWLPGPLLASAASVLAGALQRGGGAVPPQTRWAKLPEMVRRRGDLLALYQLAYALFLPAFQQRLLGEGGAALVDGLPAEMRDRLMAEIGARSPLSAISVLEQRLFLGERLLRDTDAASMAASIEIRLPLVDQALLAAVNRLPDGSRYLPLRRKAVLRRIGLRGLDPALFERPKSGFVLPFDRWIRRGLGRVMDEAMRDRGSVRATGLEPDAVARLWQAFLDRAPGVYWSRVWAIYVLVRWCQRYHVTA